MLEQNLMRIGLSEKEAKVYLAALELGPAPVQKIAAKAHVNRATTYVILEGMMKKGIITIYDQGKKRYFVAEGPSALKNIISQQQKELDEKAELLKHVHSEIQSVHNALPNKPIVKFYEGKEGLKTLLEERLEEGHKQVDVFYPDDDLVEIFNEQERKDYVGRRIQKQVFYRGVSSIKKPDPSITFPHGELHQVESDKFPMFSDIAVYGDKVSISILRGHVSGVVIQNKAVADTFRSIFKLAFESTKPAPKQ